MACWRFPQGWLCRPSSVGESHRPWPWQRRASFSQVASDHTLIVVQMAGGNDGLSTVVPFTDSLYKQMRPTLAIPDNKVLPLDTRLGLHPNLQPLKAFWDAGHLAVVEGVGYPNQSLSHFQAMDIWQTLDLNGNGSEGWLGKLVSGLVDEAGHPFKSLDVGTMTAQALHSISTQVPTLSNTKSYAVAADPIDPDRGSARMQALMKLYNSYPKTSPYAALLDATAISAQEGSRALHAADAAYVPAVTYPQEPFAAGLKILAEAIVQDLGLRVGYVTLGGFDTHANQQTTHDTLMTTLAEGLSAFYTDLTAHGKADNVMFSPGPNLVAASKRTAARVPTTALPRPSLCSATASPKASLASRPASAASTATATSNIPSISAPSTPPSSIAGWVPPPRKSLAAPSPPKTSSPPLKNVNRVIFAICDSNFFAKKLLSQIAKITLFTFLNYKTFLIII